MQTRLPTEERQAEIVAAALHLARDTSPLSITTSDIARAVGVSQGAVFKHFATKEAIWVAAMQWVRAHLLAQLQASAVGAATGVLALGIAGWRTTRWASARAWAWRRRSRCTCWRSKRCFKPMWTS